MIEKQIKIDIKTTNSIKIIRKDARDLSNELSQLTNAINGLSSTLETIENTFSELTDGLNSVIASSTVLTEETNLLSDAMSTLETIITILDGVNGLGSLKESLENIKDATKALWRIVKAHPYHALLAVVLALTAALFVLWSRKKESGDQTQRLTTLESALKDSIEKNNTEYNKRIKFAKARGASEKEILDIQKEQIEEEIELRKQNRETLEQMQKKNKRGSKSYEELAKK